MAGPDAIPAANALINGLNVLALLNGVLTSATAEVNILTSEPQLVLNNHKLPSTKDKVSIANQMPRSQIAN